MFEVIVKVKNDWIDISGVPDVELFEALSDWSSGRKEIIKIKSFSFGIKDITSITIHK